MATFVRSASLGSYGVVARRYGLDPEAMVRSAGLDPTLLTNPDLRIPAASVVELLEDSARCGDCPTFGIQMAESWRLSDFGAISLLLMHQRNLRDALHEIARYRHLLNDALALTVEDAGELVVVREELVIEGFPASPQGTELAIGVVFRMFRALLGPQWRPRGVRFTHPGPPERAVYRRVFGMSPDFGSDFNGIVCAAADLDRVNPAADAALAGHARRYLDSLAVPGASPVEQEVRRSIHALLPLGRASLGEVAAALGMNERALQRRLETAGESFSGLLNAARRDLVVRYLENRAYSLTQVGELLGFDFPSSFTRWFAGQYGRSPMTWRREHFARQRARTARRP